MDALFYNFAPGEVGRDIPKVWNTTTPEAAIAARQEGCVKALPRILADHVDTPAFARATELLLKAAVSAPLEGRPMYVALRRLPVPDEVVARMWPLLPATATSLRAERVGFRSRPANRRKHWAERPKRGDRRE